MRGKVSKITLKNRIEEKKMDAMPKIKEVVTHLKK